MTKKIFTLLVLVLLYEINNICCINGTTTEKFTIKSFDSIELIDDCEYDSDCPNYGKCLYDASRYEENKSAKDFGFCKFTFLCHEQGNCLSKYSRCINDENCENGYCDNGICRNSIISRACNEKSISKNECKANNSHQICKNNSDCFSNICKNGICVTDPKNKIYRCGTSVNIKKIKVLCKLDYEEECKNNSECFTNYCKKGICHTREIEIYKFWLVLIICLSLAACIVLSYKYYEKKKKEEAYKNIEN